MHLVSAILLFVSRLNYFENIGSFKNFSAQGLIRLVTIPLYLVVLYRAEFAIRSYRPTYNKDASRTAFTVQKTRNIREAGGSFCFSESEGNVFQWLWIELIAFMAQILFMVIQLITGFCNSTVVEEGKHGDYILVKDYRDSNTYPRVHVLNRRLQEKFASGTPFKITKGDEDDGFGEKNVYTMDQDYLAQGKDSSKSKEDLLTTMFMKLDTFKDVVTKRLDLKMKTIDKMVADDDKAPIRFYEVEGKAINSEIREVIDGFDKLLYLRRNNGTFFSILCLNTTVTIVVILGFRMAYDSPFDNDVNRSIIQAENLNFTKEDCISHYPESAYVPSLWIYLASNLALYFILKVF